MKENEQTPAIDQGHSAKAEGKGQIKITPSSNKESKNPETKKNSSSIQKELSDATSNLWRKLNNIPVEADKTPDKEAKVVRKPKNEDLSFATSNLWEKLNNLPAIIDERTEQIKPEDEIEEETFDSYSREELIKRLEQVVQEKDINTIKTKIALLKIAFLKLNKEEKQKKLKKFIEEGGKMEEYSPATDELEERFKIAFDIYKTKKVKYNEEQERIKQENLEFKKGILEELKELINSDETLKKTYDDFKALQERWKEIGQVPKSEVNTLWKNYHFYVEKFFDKVKINKELKDLDLKKNLEIKIVLCEKAEELLLEKSIMKSFKQLQKYHDEWKETGPVPLDKKEEIWERFKSASDKINQRRREYYNQLQERQESNLVEKTALCEKAELIFNVEVTSVKEWQKATDHINELMIVWKTLGPAPKNQNNEIWERFKTYLDTFYANKKEYFSKLKDQQVDNYNLKLDLCIQAEAMKNGTDWKKITSDFINLQKEWKSIGPVPRKHSDKIWKRFRVACDEFFNAKSEYYSNIHVHEADNLKQKLCLIDKVNGYKFSDDKKENLEILKGFQREWLEIGHVPIKEKDEINSKFRKTINNQLDGLNISSVEISKINYKSKLESIKNSPDAGRIISKERSVVTNKINRLREDINLWENNIGFLANSKKAEVVKEEFDRRINNAKDDLSVNEAKLKYLQEN